MYMLFNHADFIIFFTEISYKKKTNFGVKASFFLGYIYRPRYNSAVKQPAWRNWQLSFLDTLNNYFDSYTTAVYYCSKLNFRSMDCFFSFTISLGGVFHKLIKFWNYVWYNFFPTKLFMIIKICGKLHFLILYA